MMIKHAFSAKALNILTCIRFLYIFIIFFSIICCFFICWFSIYALVTHSKKSAQNNDYFYEIFGCKQKSHLKLFIIQSKIDLIYEEIMMGDLVYYVYKCVKIQFDYSTNKLHNMPPRVFLGKCSTYTACSHYKKSIK